MIRLYDTGAYLLNGTELIEDNADAAARLHQALGAQVPSKEEAAYFVYQVCPCTLSEGQRADEDQKD